VISTSVSFAERDVLDLPDALRKGDEAEINRVVQDVLVNQVGAAVFDPDVDRGVVVQEFFDVGRQLVQADGVDGRDADGAADDLLHLLQLALQLLIDVEDFLRRLIDALALARQVELLLAAVDHQRLEIALHGARLLAHGRLRDAVQLCRLGEALGLDQVREDFEVFDLHTAGGIGRSINNAYRRATLKAALIAVCRLRNLPDAEPARGWRE
jgi:hypothetical protein